ncbi:hypothetical protein WJX77_001165 [Trebouxia sp. C0004]
MADQGNEPADVPEEVPAPAAAVSEPAIDTIKSEENAEIKSEVVASVGNDALAEQEAAQPIAATSEVVKAENGEPAEAAAKVEEKESDRKDSNTDKPKDRSDRDKDRERDKNRKDMDRDRSRGKDKDSKRDRGERSRDRDRDKKSHRSKTRSRERSRRGSSRERRHRSGSRSRDRHRDSRRASSRDDRHRSSKRHYESGSSDDEYGGYVPRKRQEPPAPAVGYSTSYIDPYAALRNKSGIVSQDPKEIARQLQEQQLQARQLVLQQQAASAVAAASKTQREVYVGNLVAGLVTEEALRQLFNSTMTAAFPDKLTPGFDPVVNVSMHSEGRYAFVELRTPEMASAALQLSNQVQLLGQSISVGRPSGYVDPSKAQQAASAAAAALAAFKAGDDSAEMHQRLKDLGVPIPTGPDAATSLPAAPMPMGNIIPAPGGPMMGMGQPYPLMPQITVGPTEFLSVNGMVTPDVLVDDEEYREVIEDLREECSKYGQVMKVVVPRPPIPQQAHALFNQQNFGKAFAQFANPLSAQAAKDAIHGRLFAGSTVEVNYITAQQFGAVGGFQ